MSKIIIIFVCFLLQSSSGNFLSMFNILPDFIVIGIVLITSKNNILNGVKIGVAAGLVQDLLSYGAFGTGLFVKTLDGFFAGFFKKQIFSDNILSSMVIVSLIVVLNGLFSLIFMNIFYTRINILKELYFLTLPAAVCTGLFLGAVLLFKEIFKIIFNRILKYYGIRTASR